MSIERTSTLIERVTVKGPMSEGRRVMAELHEQGFRIIRSGPLRLDDGTVDQETFCFVAERPCPTQPS